MRLDERTRANFIGWLDTLSDDELTAVLLLVEVRCASRRARRAAESFNASPRLAELGHLRSLRGAHLDIFA